MPKDICHYIYFCLDAKTRVVCAAFAEYRIAETDERYVKRAIRPDGTEGETNWIMVAGAPEEMTSTKFDVYSMGVYPENAPGEYGFSRALELFSKNELTEKFLKSAARFIPHR